MVFDGKKVNVVKAPIREYFFMLPWCCQLFSDQSESIVLCCQSFSADVQLPWRKTAHHHHLDIRKVYGSDVNLKRSDPGPGPAHHPHLTIRKAWGWDVNLKRSDEDKARDGGAAVVSESVFRSVRIETRDKIEIFWYFRSLNKRMFSPERPIDIFENAHFF